MQTEREIQILRALVDIYVHDGVPVSSSKIQQAAGLGVSTATIRNMLASLEREGLLVKPHTSAGRIPTDEGYRLVVDLLEPDQALSNEFSSLFRDRIKDQQDVGSIMAHASKFLGSESRNLAVVYGSVLRESRVGKINLVALDGSHILVVLHLVPEYERTTIVHTNRRFHHGTIRRAEELINPVVCRKTLDEAKDALDRAVRDNITEEGLIIGEVAVNREAIFTDPPAVEMFFEEREYMLKQPELSDPTLLHLLLRILQNKEYLTTILSRRIEEKTTVTIGSENDDETLKSFSIVTSGYRMGSSRGVLGIIGPTRMRYDYAYALVGSIARELRAIGEEFS